MRNPALSLSISGIIRPRSYSKVAWVTTRRIVAFMHNLKPRRDWPIGNLISNAVRYLMLTADHQVSIASLVFPDHPGPAMVWCIHVHVIPEIRQTFLSSRRKLAADAAKIAVGSVTFEREIKWLLAALADAVRFWTSARGIVILRLHRESPFSVPCLRLLSAVRRLLCLLNITQRQDIVNPLNGGAVANFAR